MTIEIDGLREALFAQMRLPPLPEYSGNTVILRACKTLAEGEGADGGDPGGELHRA
jgi:hypothetical protein